MTAYDAPTDTQTDRIKLPFNFDVTKVMEEIKSKDLQDFIYYNVMTLRGPAHMIDPSLPVPPPAEDYADGTWTNWLNSNTLNDLTTLKEIVEFFQQHCTVNLVRLLRLAPGATVKEHTDPTLGLQIERSMVRLTVPIKTDDQVTFYLNGTPVDMQPGECWYLRLTDPHRVVNDSLEERINLTIDVIPNEWLRSTILNAE